MASETLSTVKQRVLQARYCDGSLQIEQPSIFGPLTAPCKIPQLEIYVTRTCSAGLPLYALCRRHTRHVDSIPQLACQRCLPLQLVLDLTELELQKYLCQLMITRARPGQK